MPETSRSKTASASSGVPVHDPVVPAENQATQGPTGAPAPRDQAENPIGETNDAGYHDSLTGRPVDIEGNFIGDLATQGEGPIPQHRIVANDWPAARERADQEDDEQAQKR
jgi:hypothetical protein